MSEVLAPRLKIFGGLADNLTEPDERVFKAMRVEIRQAGAAEGVAKDCANSRGTAPVSPFQPDRLKLASCPQRNARRREERIVVPPGDTPPTPPRSGESRPRLEMKKVVKVLLYFVRTSRAS